MREVSGLYIIHIIIDLIADVIAWNGIFRCYRKLK